MNVCPKTKQIIISKNEIFSVDPNFKKIGRKKTNSTFLAFHLNYIKLCLDVQTLNHSTCHHR